MVFDHWQFLAKAERKYAIALARYEVAEHPTEKIVGLKALDEADSRIQKEKAKLKAEMERIAGSIRRLCNPAWTPGHIGPLHQRRTLRRVGEISKAAYRLLRREKKPLSSREVARLIAPELGLEAPNEHDINLLDSAVRAAFAKREKAGQLILHPGTLKPRTPMRWSIKPREAPASSASANALPKPWTPSG